MNNPTVVFFGSVYPPDVAQPRGQVTGAWGGVRRVSRVPHSNTPSLAGTARNQEPRGEEGLGAGATRLLALSAAPSPAQAPSCSCRHPGRQGALRRPGLAGLEEPEHAYLLLRLTDGLELSKASFNH